MGDRTAIDFVFPVWVFSYGYIYVYSRSFKKMQFFAVIDCGLCLLTASGVFFLGYALSSFHGEILLGR
jgi:hypothetical protein